MNKQRTVAYWTTTITLALVLFSGGIADVMRVPATTEGVQELGYPAYFVTMLGIWKLLGAIALVAPRFPRLKEWAYAGIFFNFSGAVVSHLVSESAAGHVAVTVILGLFTLVSWALRPPGRTLGTPVPASGSPASPGRENLEPASST